VVADFFPALLALQLMAALALATALYHRLARQPRGMPLGRFSGFRFSEHLGWAAVLALIVLVVPRLAAAKAAAANLLLVAGALYALRGFAVAAYGLQVLGTGGIFLTTLLAAILLFLLPMVLAGAVMLGVIDAGLNLRRRWGAIRAGK
jgi:uncharacterized protein YybS (DUF2232 family)